MMEADIKRAVDALDGIRIDDPEAAHSEADGILLDALPLAIREAYERLQKRSPWWTTA